MRRGKVRLRIDAVRRLKAGWRRVRSALGSPAFLCDSCRFDYGSACRRPERPNATDCPDYKKR